MGQQQSTAEATSDLDRLIEGLQTLKERFQNDPNFQNTVKNSLTFRNFQFPMKGTEEEVAFLLNCVEDNQGKDKIIKELKEALDKERNSHLITILDWQKTVPSIHADEKLRLSHEAHTGYMSHLLAENQELRGTRNAVIEKEREMEIQKFQMSDEIALILEESDNKLAELKQEKLEMENQLRLKNDAIEVLSNKNSQLTADNWQLDNYRKTNDTQVNDVIQRNKEMEERLKEVTSELKEVYYQLESHKGVAEIAEIEKKNEEQAGIIEVLKGDLNMTNILKTELEEELKKLKLEDEKKEVKESPILSGSRVELLKSSGPPVSAPSSILQPQMRAALTEKALEMHQLRQNGFPQQAEIKFDEFRQMMQQLQIPRISKPQVFNLKSMQTHLEAVTQKLESTERELALLKKEHKDEMENLKREFGEEFQKLHAAIERLRRPAGTPAPQNFENFAAHAWARPDIQAMFKAQPPGEQAVLAEIHAQVQAKRAAKEAVDRARAAAEVQAQAQGQTQAQSHPWIRLQQARMASQTVRIQMDPSGAGANNQVLNWIANTPPPTAREGPQGPPTASEMFGLPPATTAPKATEKTWQIPAQYVEKLWPSLIDNYDALFVNNPEAAPAGIPMEQGEAPAPVEQRPESSSSGSDNSWSTISGDGDYQDA